jgi:membrane protein implicated in regulation of membrane protease activity
MLTILLYISLISGGILVLLLTLSFISGLDLDLGLDFGDSDIDAGGMGILKGALTFFSIGSYVVRSILITDSNPIIAFTVGAVAGGIAVFLLSMMLKWLLRQQSNVNWSFEDSIYQKGKVYLKIPAGGTGIIQVNVNGALRELKAKSVDDKEIPTGATVQVESIEGEIAIVTTKVEF